MGFLLLFIQEEQELGRQVKVLVDTYLLVHTISIGRGEVIDLFRLVISWLSSATLNQSLKLERCLIRIDLYLIIKIGVHVLLLLGFSFSRSRLLLILINVLFTTVVLYYLPFENRYLLIVLSFDPRSLIRLSWNLNNTVKSLIPCIICGWLVYLLVIRCSKKIVPLDWWWYTPARRGSSN